LSVRRCHLPESEGFGLLLAALRSGYASCVGCEGCGMKRQLQALSSGARMVWQFEETWGGSANSKAIVGIKTLWLAISNFSA